MSDRDDIGAPPEGATCAEHPERDALVTCPRCGSYCCIACWHDSVRRCHACLLREPGPPVPWEDRERGVLARFVGTLVDAARPYRSAPTLTYASPRRATGFALLTFVPLALLSGVIPYTHTLGFGPSWRLSVLGDPSETAIALDVVRAAGIGLFLAIAKLALLAVPYHSLSRAYAATKKATAPLALMAYRAWLVPLEAVLVSLVVWAMPLSPNETLLALTWVVPLVPFLLLLASMIATARMAGGSGPIASFVVVLVPFLLLMFVGVPLLTPLVEAWTPDPAVIEAAVRR